MPSFSRALLGPSWVNRVRPSRPVLMRPVTESIAVKKSQFDENEKHARHCIKTFVHEKGPLTSQQIYDWAMNSKIPSPFLWPINYTNENDPKSAKMVSNNISDRSILFYSLTRLRKSMRQARKEKQVATVNLAKWNSMIHMYNRYKRGSKVLQKIKMLKNPKVDRTDVKLYDARTWIWVPHKIIQALDPYYTKKRLRRKFRAAGHSRYDSRFRAFKAMKQRPTHLHPGYNTRIPRLTKSKKREMKRERLYRPSTSLSQNKLLPSLEQIRNTFA